MRTLDCADVRELAPELALGVLDGEARADVVQHLERCAGCRATVTELSETADSMVLLAPEAEPPPGFERRVVAHLTGDVRRSRGRTAKLGAAVAAAAVILSVVTVRVIDGARSDGGSPAAVRTVAMIGADGSRVGRVEVIGDGDPAELALSVDYALADGAYRVVLAPEQGARRVLGTITVTGGHGTWSGPATIGDRPADLELVDDAGEVPCSANLPSV